MITGRLALFCPRGLLDLARELVHVRRHEVAHAHPHQLAHPAGGDVDHPASVVSSQSSSGDDSEGFGELVAALERVQERGVHRVHAVVLHLQPVARQRELAPPASSVKPGTSYCRRGETRGRRSGGPRYAKTRPANSCAGYAPWQTRSQSRLPAGSPGVSRTAAVDVEHPAVIAAADAALDGIAELERRPAVRAVQVEHADRARRGRGRPPGPRRGCARASGAGRARARRRRAARSGAGTRRPACRARPRSAPDRAAARRGDGSRR